MKKRTYQRITRPIIGRISNLNSFVLERRKDMKTAIRYNYADDLLKQLLLLFKYAMRQLAGKDYVKRAMELCEEIQAQTYLIRNLGGLSDRDTATIDVEVDAILDELIRISKSASSESSHTKE